MGYQNLGGSPPRFYISILQWLNAVGKLEFVSSAFQYDIVGIKFIDINPTSIGSFTGGGGYNQTLLKYRSLAGNFEDLMPNDKNFFMVLGHNFASTQVEGVQLKEVGLEYSWLADQSFVNYTQGGDGVQSATLDGFSIGKANNAENANSDEVALFFRSYNPSLTYKLGSLLYGTYFDMPHSPDLSLTMSHSYDGIKQVTTKGGSTLSNANYHKPPNWGDREAWELRPASNVYEIHDNYRYSGRRTWDLSFSYISDSDIEPYNYRGNVYESDTEMTNVTVTEGNDNWFTNVIYYTMGGHLPFIFCPDPSIEFLSIDGNPTPPRVPEFAICRFDMRTFKRTQISFKTYNIKIKVVESW